LGVLAYHVSAEIIPSTTIAPLAEMCPCIPVPSLFPK